MTTGFGHLPSDRSDGTLAWRDVLAETRRQLEASGVEDADLEARHLVAHVVGVPTPELFTRLDDRATRLGITDLESRIGRRAGGEPLQYVLGEWSFRRLDLLVDRRVLIPRPETEVVVEIALGELDRQRAALDQVGSSRPLRAVDLGTGSGCIALSLATERPRVEVVATDVSSDALAVATANLAGIGRAGTRVQLRCGRWFEALADERDLAGGIDLIVSNPPYVPGTDVLPAEVASWEPATALVPPGPRTDGTACLVEILDQAGPWLAPGGVVVLECGDDQGRRLLDHVRREVAWAGDTRIERDLAGRDRVLVVRSSGAVTDPTSR